MPGEGVEPSCPTEGAPDFEFAKATSQLQASMASVEDDRLVVVGEFEPKVAVVG